MAHDHGNRNERRTFWAAALTGGFMVAEVAGGLVAGSLALIADAAHMLTDAASLALAWLAFRLGRRPSDARRTFGFARLQILVAFANGLSLVFIIGWIAVEAIGRLLAGGGDVLGVPMLAIAAAGLAVNVVAFALLHGADRQNLNIRGALLHVAGDLLGSLAALAAAVVIIATGWTPIDPLLSLLVAAVLAFSAWRLIRESGHILLEGAPAAIDVAELKRDLEENIAGIVEIHHVHAWSLTGERPLVTLHARIGEGIGFATAAALIRQRLEARFGIRHATVEVEAAGNCGDSRPASDP